MGKISITYGLLALAVAFATMGAIEVYRSEPHGAHLSYHCDAPQERCNAGGIEIVEDK